PSNSTTVDVSVGLSLDVTLGLDLTNMATSTLTHPVLPRASDFFVQFNEIEATGSVSVPDLNLDVGAADSNASASLSIQHGQVDLAATVDVAFPGAGTDGRIPFTQLASLVSDITFTPQAVFSMTLPMTGSLSLPGGLTL